VNEIGIYKYNSKVLVEGKTRKINDLKKSGQKTKRSRNYGMCYSVYNVTIDDLSVRLFLIIKGRKRSMR